MPLSIFIDALPFNEIEKNYSDWFSDMQISELIPNIAYSSSLHWQLYLDKYPDERGVLVDWVKEREENKAVRMVSTIMSPFDKMGNFTVLTKKVFDRIVFRKNTFANIPYRQRKKFSQKGKYLFWKKEIYGKETLFSGYNVISQDEEKKSFEQTVSLLNEAISKKEKNIFAVFGFADAMGHKCARGEEYSRRLLPYMQVLKESIEEYRKSFPEEEVIIVSDHGMSTIKNKVSLNLEKKFGKQGKKTYIAYVDSAIMCIWAKEDELKKKISEYLKTRDEGHLLTEKEREYYGATDRKFGDIIYILREGNVFSDNWFGKSLKKPSEDGAGMHGFWPEREAKDSLACIMLMGNKRKLEKISDYRYASKLIKEVMKGEE